ncbi:MAG: hypothetical protein ACRC7S_08940 [Cetobacterium sp.]
MENKKICRTCYYADEISDIQREQIGLIEIDIFNCDIDCIIVKSSHTCDKYCNREYVELELEKENKKLCKEDI